MTKLLQFVWRLHFTTFKLHLYAIQLSLKSYAHLWQLSKPIQHLLSTTSTTNYKYTPSGTLINITNAACLIGPNYSQPHTRKPTILCTLETKHTNTRRKWDVTVTPSKILLQPYVKPVTVVPSAIQDMSVRVLLVFVNTSNWYFPPAEENYQLVCKLQSCVCLKCLKITLIFR